MIKKLFGTLLLVALARCVVLGSVLFVPPVRDWLFNANLWPWPLAADITAATSYSFNRKWEPVRSLALSSDAPCFDPGKAVMPCRLAVDALNATTYKVVIATVERAPGFKKLAEVARENIIYDGIMTSPGRHGDLVEGCLIFGAYVNVHNLVC